MHIPYPRMAAFLSLLLGGSSLSTPANAQSSGSGQACTITGSWERCGTELRLSEAARGKGGEIAKDGRKIGGSVEIAVRYISTRDISGELTIKFLHDGPRYPLKLVADGKAVGSFMQTGRAQRYDLKAAFGESLQPLKAVQRLALVMDADGQEVVLLDARLAETHIAMTGALIEAVKSSRPSDDMTLRQERPATEQRQGPPAGGPPQLQPKGLPEPVPSQRDAAISQQPHDAAKRPPVRRGGLQQLLDEVPSKALWEVPRTVEECEAMIKRVDHWALGHLHEETYVLAFNSENLRRVRDACTRRQFQNAYSQLKSMVGTDDEWRAYVQERYGSKAKSGKTKDCFLTTVCCEAVGLSDDCFELTMMRRLRDGYVLPRPDGAYHLANYLAFAPILLNSIEPQSRRPALLRFYATHILPCAVLVRLGCYAAAFRWYLNMMSRMSRLPDTLPA